LKIVYEAVAYKPLISLFNMTGAAQQNTQLAGVGESCTIPGKHPIVNFWSFEVNYAAALALEVRNTSSGEIVIRFNFKNGTDEDDFKTYNFLGQSDDVPLSSFIDALSVRLNLSPAFSALRSFQSHTINSTAQWCQVCNNTNDRGCDAIAGFISSGMTGSSDQHIISPIGAGFLGASLTLATIFAMFGMLLLLGRLTFVHKPRTRIRKSNQSSSTDVSLLEGRFQQ
jgi:prostatic aicd phosphatase